MLKSSRDKNEGTYRSREGGEGPLCDPGSELLLLLLRGRARVVINSATITNGMKKKKKMCHIGMYSHSSQ